MYCTINFIDDYWGLHFQSYLPFLVFSFLRMLCDWCDIMGDNEESFVAENVADLVVGLFSIITCRVGLVLIME